MTTITNRSDLSPAQQLAIVGDWASGPQGTLATGIAIHCRRNTGDKLVALGLATVTITRQPRNNTYGWGRKPDVRNYLLTDEGKALRQAWQAEFPDEACRETQFGERLVYAHHARYGWTI
jgi:hypothetical protein